MSLEVDVDLNKRSFGIRYRPVAVMSVAILLITLGVSGLIAPWWQPLLAVVLERAGVSATLTVSFWASIAVTAVGCGLLAYKIFGMDAQERILKLDYALVGRLPPQPIQLNNFFDNLTTNSAYMTSECFAFREEYERYAAPHNALLDKSSARAFARFRSAAAQLQHFIDQNFDWYPDDQQGWQDHRYRLKPDLNPDTAQTVGDSAAYDALERAMDAHVRAAKDAYDAFLKRLRQAGHLP